MDGNSSPRHPMRGAPSSLSSSGGHPANMHDHRSASVPTTNTPTAGSSSGKKPLLVNRSAEELRRNGLNMEKMIKKNVMASSRPGSLKRGLAVVEYFKAKNKQQDGGDGGSNSSSSAMDDPQQTQGLLKRKKLSPPASASAHTPSHGQSSKPFNSIALDESAAQTSDAGLVSVASPSPRRSVDHGAPRSGLLLSAKASSSGVQPLDDRAFATRGPPSITRLSQQLTSPLRHRNSPVRSRIQAMTEESIRRISETGSATGGGVNKGLTAALEQVDIAPPTKVSTAKSPFQSFQSKFSGQTRQQPSPAKASALASLLASPLAQQSRQHQLPPRSGPVVVDLSHGAEEKSSAAANASAAATPTTPTRVSPSSISGGIARSPKPSIAPKPARALFSSRPAVATKSLCFSTEGVATSLDVSPDGEIIVVGFTDGSVRLYEMDSNVPSDRHGYLLGHIDEESSQSASNANLRVKITSDGRYVFVGCRTGPRVVMSINLHNYRNEKESEDEDYEHLQKHFHSNGKLRGFSDVTKYVAPNGGRSNRNAYYLLCGLGVGNLHLWRFVEAQGSSSDSDPSWHYLYEIRANGNTAIAAEFLPPVDGDDGGSLTIAGTCDDKNLRVWELEHASQSDDQSSSDGNDTGDEGEDPCKGNVHAVKSHIDIPHTKDVAAIYGEYAYGISPTGEAYRITIRNPAIRHVFEMEKFDTGGSNNKSRRSTILLESVFASDDGKVLIAVSTEGIFYYSNNVSTEDPSKASFLKIIGKNASLNPQYKTPMKVYTPQLVGDKSKKDPHAPPPLASMMAVITNPLSEDEGGDGYVNVDPTEGFASRWMVPSKGRDCWVCGVRNISHWQAPTEQQHKAAQKGKKSSGSQQDDSKPSSAKKSSSSSGEKKHSSGGVDAPSPHGRSSGTPLASPTRSSKAKAKANAAKKSATLTKPGSSLLTQSSLVPAASPSGSSSSHGKPPTVSSGSKVRQRIETDEEEPPGRRSANNSSHHDLLDELERYKERYNKIVMEWQRRLKGERQMRRLWKTRETEFNKELDETLEKLYTAEQEVVALKDLHKDSEKRYIFEKLKAEQQSSVKSRYEQLCAQMQEKLGLLDDQKRVMEQTTKTLLQEVDRNVRSLKPTTLLERNECIVCKDKEATTAIIPCGHLVFCEDDGEVYRRNSPVNNVVCPICQRELISLLRIY